MTSESALLIALLVLLLTGGVYVTSVATTSRANSFFAYIGGLTKDRFRGSVSAQHGSGREVTSDLVSSIVLIACFFILGLGVLLSTFYDRIAYGRLEAIFPYQVEVRHDFERARSDIKLMQQDLEGLKQHASQPRVSITAVDGRTLERCEEIRVRQLALQGELVRIKGEIARKGPLQGNGEPAPILPKVEGKLDRLAKDIADLSAVCAGLGKVGLSVGDSGSR